MKGRDLIFAPNRKAAIQRDKKEIPDLHINRNTVDMIVTEKHYYNVIINFLTIIKIVFLHIHISITCEFCVLQS